MGHYDNEIEVVEKIEYAKEKASTKEYLNDEFKKFIKRRQPKI